MIGWLSGKIRAIRGERVTLDVGGVGYEVLLPAPALSQLKGIGSQAEFFIHTHVREDALALFGFLTLSDRDLFDHLIGVTGIGAKTALGILSSIPALDLIQAIQRRDVALLQRTPGIGKKTAERMLLELADKLRGFEVGAQGGLVNRIQPGTPEEELVSALLNLGYRRAEAEAAVSRADLSKSPSFDTMLKETLKTLAR
jgi:Holliday junction DNA helicase RuvA